MIKLKAHKILEILFKHYMDGKKKTKGGNIVTDLGRSFTTIQINEKTNYPINIIDEICISLEANEYVKLHDSNKEFGVYRYIITDKGMEAYISKHYVFSFVEFLLKWIPICISVLSLLVAAIVAWFNISNTKSIDKLQLKISELQEKVILLEKQK